MSYKLIPWNRSDSSKKTYKIRTRRRATESLETCVIVDRRNQKWDCRELEDSPDNVCKSEVRKAKKRERENHWGQKPVVYRIWMRTEVNMDWSISAVQCLCFVSVTSSAEISKKSWCDKTINFRVGDFCREKRVELEEQ